MRSTILGTTTLLAMLATSGLSSAKEISNAEYQALSAQNTAQVAALEGQNVQLAQANTNPWGTPQGIAYMQAHPYAMGDLVAGAHGFILPGWYDFKQSGVGTSDAGGF